MGLNGTGGESISSNILADRLKSLMALGVLTRADDPTHKQKGIYSLSEMAIELVPIMAHLGAWGSKWLPVSEELSIRAILLEEGGPPLWEQFMSELRAEHLGAPLPPGQGRLRAPSDRPATALSWTGRSVRLTTHRAF